METVECGIIGMGRQGSIFSRALLKNDCFSHSTFHAYDPNVEYLKENHYQDWDVDAVVVCVPHSLTCGVVCDCLENGWDVFAEKPPGTCYAECNKMVEKAETLDRTLVFGFQHRFYQHVQALKQLVDGKKIHWMKGFYTKKSLDGWRLNPKLACHGILLGQGVHMLDLFQYLSGEQLSLVGSTIAYHTFPLEDNVMAVFEPDTFLHSSFDTHRKVFELKIKTDDEEYKIEGLATVSRSYLSPEKLVVKHPDAESITFYNEHPEKVFKHEISLFADEIHGKKTDLCKGEEALSVMRLVDKIYARS